MSWQLGAHPDDVPRAEVDAPGVEPDGDDRPVWDRPINRVVGRVVMRPRADTSQANTLILLPLLPVLLSMASVVFARGWDTTLLGVLIAFVAVVQFFVARRDARVLGERGFVDQAPPVLALISPILYLGIRARRCDGHDPSAISAVRGAIVTTSIAVLMVAIGLGFQLAMSPLFTGGGQE
ncbi:hypothetical protein GCM10027515_06710 [Schumannella luteola]|uniref:Uncharacterized protein n=1 Tax=Schumannella luteola TaxID=472059 RepID=A0A852YGQ1_9MICO|nr:hypothetical protein [Schumannella luteola]NYG98198.1 hypothetical protein [Schumannella luteola]TPX05035.1 hypothetical protein FJ656_08720 [Schumannella luteola]